MDNLIYQRGTELECQDVIDFADLVFSKDGGSHDFQSLVPRLYAKGMDSRKHHHLALRGDKIKAMVCVLPQKLQVGEEELLFSGLGTVSVHPQERGAGHMRRLMKQAVDQMEQEGHAFCVLGGLRQRYEYFGFHPAGQRYEYTLLSENVKHAYKNVSADSVGFLPVTAEAPEYEEVCRLFSRAPVHNKLSANELLHRMHNWNSVCYSIQKSGEWIGYCCASPDKKTVHELRLRDGQEHSPVVKKYFEQFAMEEVCFLAGPWECELNTHLAGVCQDFEIKWDGYYRIMKFLPVIRAYSKLKADLVPLADGKLVVEVEDREKIRFAVRNGEVSVTASEEEADLVLTEKEAPAFFFSHTGLSVLGERGRCLPACVWSWFPLPLNLPELDNI